MKDRKIKVYPTGWIGQWNYITVPVIRLQGRWLEKLGFNIGDPIIVSQEGHKLVIRKDGVL